VDAVQQVPAVDGQQSKPFFWVGFLQELVDQLLGTIRILQIQNHFFC
jgi:hypothetical protein